MDNDPLNSVCADDLEAWLEEIKPSYGYFLDSPREDGTMVEFIHPEDEEYASAEKCIAQKMKRIFNRRPSAADGD